MVLGKTKNIEQTSKEPTMKTSNGSTGMRRRSEMGF